MITLFGRPTDPSQFEYIIKAQSDDHGMPEKIRSIPNTCHHLWKGLKKHGACVPSSTSCGEDEDDAGVLVWKFETPIGCNKGMVHSAWYEGTSGNRHGFIRCSNEEIY